MASFITRLFILAIIAAIGVIYYHIELVPFAYQAYDRDITRLQKFDAELEEAIVQIRFGSVKHYDPIFIALDGSRLALNDLKAKLDAKPNENISRQMAVVEKAIKLKEDLVAEFQLINPVLINAISQFSLTMTQIIEEETHTSAIEGCFEQIYQYRVLNKINDLFKGVLNYVIYPVESDRKNMLRLARLLEGLKQKPENLDLAIMYARTVLNDLPKINYIQSNIFNVPILSSIHGLNTVYENEHDIYLEESSLYRIGLYLLALLLVLVVGWAFARLRRTITKLNIEVKQRIQAQDELAQINVELEDRVKQRTQELSQKNKDLNQALDDLHAAQDQLIIQEKMASVGMLTTGIAHEIKNPLNFINNFSDLTADLIDELQEDLQKQSLDEKSAQDINDIIGDLKSNATKIKQYGQRADTIVETMLMHSDTSSARKEPCSLPPIITNSLDVALTKYKDKNPDFNVNISKQLENLSEINVIPQSISKVFLYLFDNAFYALDQKKQKQGDAYQPELNISAKLLANKLEIRVKDNGMGIAKAILDKIYEPFFTTKPTGKGNTGLGLSICYDTIVKQHKGELVIQSQEGEYTECIISLPVN